MSAEDFLRRVEQTGLVSEPLMEELKKRVAESDRALRPEMLAKLLVDREELTPGQARKIIAQMLAGPAPPPPAESADEPEQDLDESADEDNTLTLVSENDDLDFVKEEADEPVTLSASDVLGDRATDADLSSNLNGDDILGDLGTDDTPSSAPVRTMPPSTRPEPEEELVEAVLLDDDDLLDDSSCAIAPVIPANAIASDAGGSSNAAASGADTVLDDVLADPAIAKSNVVIRRKQSLWGIFGDLFPSKRGPRKNRWDSPLILLGGAALVLLVGLTYAFYGLFYSETAEELFEKGKDAYENQSYAMAIETFNRFETRFSENTKASLARVRIGMAKIRQITDLSNPDWESALSQAQSSLVEIKAEESFGDVRNELAKLLPDISAGLVEKSQAADSTDEKQRILDLAVQCMTLVNNSEYLPTSVRGPQDIRIEEITTNIDLVRRDIERERALAKAIADINSAADAGKITQAYRQRDDLVDKFPTLSDNVTLRDTLQSVTSKERAAVTYDVPNISPSASDHPSDFRLRIALSDQRGKEIAGVENHVLGALVRGAIYGLRATDGTVLWRRYVGYEASAVPVPVNDTPGSDQLIVDAHRGELQRIESATGKLVWRLPCPKPLSAPLVYGDRVFVTCGQEDKSMLLAINATDGTVTNAAQFPVGCSISPSLLEERNEIVQLGNHSSAYVLDSETLKCKSVFSPGHSRGSVSVPPIPVGSSIMLAVNNGRDAAKLHTFVPLPVANVESSDGENDDKGDQWTRVGKPIDITGQVKNAPSVDGRRALVVSELGELHVLELPIDSGQPQTLALSEAVGKNFGESFGLLSRSRIWVANRTLSRYELQSTRGEVVTSWSRDREDRFLNPLRRVGDYLFHVRRRVGMQGATVAATRINGNGQPEWQTDVGVPSSAVVSSSGKVHAVTMNGAMFPVQAGSVLSRRSSRIDETLISHAFEQQLTVAKDGNVSVFAAAPPFEHIVNANLDSGSLDRIGLRIDPDQVTAPLATFANSLLAPCNSGAIYLLDPETGRQRVNPFTPRLDAGTKVHWLACAGIGSRQFLAADKSGHLYRVGVEGNQLTQQGEGNIDGPLIAGLVSSGNSAFAVSQTGALQELVAIDGAKLQSMERWPLNGGLAWGPQEVGSFVVVADNANSVYAFDTQGKLAFQIPDLGPLSGAPLERSDSLVFASTDGRISVVGSKGNVSATKKLSEPLGSGPVAFKGRLLVSGWDGTLYLVDVPQ